MCTYILRLAVILPLTLLGTCVFAGDVTVNPGETLEGVGPITGNLLNNGTVSPGYGSTLGQMEVQQDYVQSSIATLNINVVGTQSSSLMLGTLILNNSFSINEEAPISVNNGFPGVANLGGTLHASWLGGYAPSGTVYHIIQFPGGAGPVSETRTQAIPAPNAGSLINGRFDRLELDPTPIIHFDISYVDAGIAASAEAEGVPGLNAPAILPGVFLILHRNSYLSVGGTQNQRRVGAYIDLFSDSATGDLRDVLNQLDMLDLEHLRQAFDILSSEVYGAYSDIAFDNAGLLQESLERRLAELRFTYTGNGLGVASMMDFAGPALADNTQTSSVMTDATPPKGKEDPRSLGPNQKRWSVFANGYGHFARQNGRTSHPGFDYTTAGALVGADYRLNKNVLFGLFTGFASTSADLDQLGSHAGVQGISVGGYASFFGWDGIYGNTIFSYGFNSYDADRNIAFGNLIRRAHSETDGGQINASIGGGKDFNWGPLTIGPSGSLQYVHLGVDGFTETGAGDVSLRVRDQEQDSLRLAVGGRLSHAFKFEWGNLAPEFRAKYVHEFLDGSRAITSQFYGSGAGSFYVNAGERGRDSALLGAGLTATVGRNIQTYANYDLNVGSKDYTAHGIMGGFRIKF